MTIIRIISCIIPIISNVCPRFSSLQSQPTHCRPTYIDPMRCIMPSHQQESSPSCHMGPIHAFFFCIIRIISLLYPAWTGQSLVHRLHRRGLGLSDATATQVEGSAPGVTPFGNDAAVDYGARPQILSRLGSVLRLSYLEIFVDSRYFVYTNRKIIPQNGYLHSFGSVNRKFSPLS